MGYSHRVAASWVRAPMRQLPAFGELGDSPDFPKAAGCVQASSLQLPAPQVQNDSVHPTITQALTTGQTTPTPQLLAHSPAYSPQKLHSTGASHSYRAAAVK